ncbi:hypothetical protein HPG69_010642 [Diceros bicornis minor]|uniref:Uncharacterized protein n=1 Tax=Diceros bicornis minor TaxID=77932 RepID=A0A7J7EX64_DICBM|nr:hypothetical protein HPG69_010642 [Diceros bicornis minor]
MLSNLVQLNISNNPHLLSLNKYTFANTSSLRYLDLRNTGLQTLDHTAFHNLITLQTLYLSGNPWKCNCSFLDFTIYLIVSHLNHPESKSKFSHSLAVENPVGVRCIEGKVQQRWKEGYASCLDNERGKRGEGFR